jgi:hypothetical protein
VKDQWIKTKLKFDLYLGMAKQCTKYQMNIWKHEKKVRKTENSWYFSKSIRPWLQEKSVNQNWTRTWSVSWYGKAIYQISNEYLKHEKKKCGKQRICDIFLSPRVITSRKINESKPNSNLICISVWQNKVPNIKWISESTKGKSAENWEFVIFF